MAQMLCKCQHEAEHDPECPVRRKIYRLEDELENRHNEIKLLQGVIEELCPPEDGFGQDGWEILKAKELIVEVEPSQEFIDEWGNDVDCWQYVWSIEEKGGEDE